MNQVNSSFDWLAFIVRVSAVVTLTTWLLIEHRPSFKGVVLVVGIGYVILPAIAYFHTRYYNTRFMGWIIEAVRRKIG